MILVAQRIPPPSSDHPAVIAYEAALTAARAFASSLRAGDAKQAPLVLVVDDDIEILDALQEILAEDGYRVMRARNGAEGLAAMGTARPDLILLDLMMPVFDGWWFRARMAEHDVFASIPTLVISAHGSHEVGEHSIVIERLVEEGNFFRKPFDLDVLLTTIQRRIETTAGMARLTRQET